MEKGKITISIVVFFISMMLVSLIFIQFRTVEESNAIGIESMREDELRQEILNWKTKYNEIDEKIKSNNEKIEEYAKTIQNNQQSSELIDKELNEYNMLVGKTDVTGDGIIMKLSDNPELSYTSSNLVYLINELKYSGAEAISINGQRVVNTTDIVGINSNQYILVNGERIVSPYEIKAIGNKDNFEKIINFPNEGFYPYYKSKGYTIEMNYQSNIKINGYNKEITLKYLSDKKED